MSKDFDPVSYDILFGNLVKYGLNKSTVRGNANWLNCCDQQSEIQLEANC